MARSWAFFSSYGVPAFVTRLEDHDGVVGRYFFRDLAKKTRANIREGTTIGPLCFVSMQGEVCAPIGMRIKDAFRRRFCF